MAHPPGHPAWITLGGGTLYTLSDLVADRPYRPRPVIEALKWHACKAIRPYWSLGPAAAWEADPTAVNNCIICCFLFLS